eukprot:PhM_4_TR7907/c0_g1_i1/m.68572
MSSTHPLDGDGITAALFQTLAKRPHYTMEAVRLKFFVPDTVIYHGTPAAWFFTDKKEMSVRRRPAQDLDKNTITQFFSRPGRETTDIVSTYLDTTESRGSGCSMSFMDEKEAYMFLSDDSPTHCGLLQRFIQPKGTKNQVFQAVWSPQFLVVQKRANRKKISDRLCGNDAKGITYEGHSHHAEDFSCSGEVKRRIHDACQSFVDFFASVDHHYVVTRMVLYFKEDERERLWLLYSSSIRIQEKHYDVMKSRIDRLALTPDFQGLSFRESPRRRTRERVRSQLANALKLGTFHHTQLQNIAAASAPGASSIRPRALTPSTHNTKLHRGGTPVVGGVPFRPSGLPSLGEMKAEVTEDSRAHNRTTSSSCSSRLTRPWTAMHQRGNPRDAATSDRIEFYRRENEALEHELQKVTVARLRHMKAVRDIDHPVRVCFSRNTASSTTPPPPDPAMERQGPMGSMTSPTSSGRRSKLHLNRNLSRQGSDTHARGVPLPDFVASAVASSTQLLAQTSSSGVMSHRTQSVKVTPLTPETNDINVGGGAMPNAMESTHTLATTATTTGGMSTVSCVAGQPAEVQRRSRAYEIVLSSLKQHHDPIVSRAQCLMEEFFDALYGTISDIYQKTAVSLASSSPGSAHPLVELPVSYDLYEVLLPEFSGVLDKIGVFRPQLEHFRRDSIARQHSYATLKERQKVMFGTVDVLERKQKNMQVLVGQHQYLEARVRACEADGMVLLVAHVDNLSTLVLERTYKHISTTVMTRLRRYRAAELSALSEGIASPRRVSLMAALRTLSPTSSSVSTETGLAHDLALMGADRVASTLVAENSHHIQDDKE